MPYPTTNGHGSHTRLLPKRRSPQKPEAFYLGFFRVASILFIISQSITACSLLLMVALKEECRSELMFMAFVKMAEVVLQRVRSGRVFTCGEHRYRRWYLWLDVLVCWLEVGKLVWECRKMISGAHHSDGLGMGGAVLCKVIVEGCAKACEVLCALIKSWVAMVDTHSTGHGDGHGVNHWQYLGTEDASRRSGSANSWNQQNTAKWLEHVLEQEDQMVQWCDISCLLCLWVGACMRSHGFNGFDAAAVFVAMMSLTFSVCHMWHERRQILDHNQPVGRSLCKGAGLRNDFRRFCKWVGTLNVCVAHVFGKRKRRAERYHWIYDVV